MTAPASGEMQSRTAACPGHPVARADGSEMATVRPTAPHTTALASKAVIGPEADSDAGTAAGGRTSQQVMAWVSDPMCTEKPVRVSLGGAIAPETGSSFQRVMEAMDTLEGKEMRRVAAGLEIRRVMHCSGDAVGQPRWAAGQVVALHGTQSPWDRPPHPTRT